MLFAAGYVYFDLCLDHRVQAVVVAVIIGGSGFVYHLVVPKILEQPADQELQCFLLLDVDDALPCVLSTSKG